MEELLTVKEVSEILKVSEQCIYTWVRKERIPFVYLNKQVNGSIRFNKAQIQEWVYKKKG